MLQLPNDVIAAIYDHARAEYPRECCGAVFSVERDGELAWDVVRCVNIQDRLHAQDPARFPRDARTAYAIDPQELWAINRRADEPGQRLAVLYHSHPDADAYFSQEDFAFAAPWGEPAYPGVVYLIVSVRRGAVAGHKLFGWDAPRATFTELSAAV